MKPRAAALSVILALALLAAPLASDGQQPAKVYRIGFLSTRTPPAPTDTTPQHCPIKGWPEWQAWLEGLREYGYLQGQNLIIECRYTEGRYERAPALAAELVSLKPDLLVAITAPSVRAAKQATSTIPIVMVGLIDPVGKGLVASLAHPGGNVTGLTNTVGMQIVGKRLQLLKEAVPTVSRVATLDYWSGPPNLASPYYRNFEAAAQALNLTLQSHYVVRGPEELEGAFTAMTKARVEALYVVDDPFFDVRRQQIAELAAQSRLPAVYCDRYYAEAGGLLAYAANTPDVFRRLGSYVDKIFKGANPGDLPVEQPTKFELIINLKTAKALGLTIPQSLLNRADEVIQ